MRAAAIVGCALPIGCSPVVSGAGFFGVGCYGVTESSPVPDVLLAEVRGVGVLTIGGRLILGYADIAMLTAAPDATGFHAEVRGADIYTGAAAESEAARMAVAALLRATLGEKTESKSRESAVGAAPGGVENDEGSGS